MRIEDMVSSDGISSHYNKYGASLYKVMTSELDANNEAFEKVSSLRNEYKDEGKYQEYLSGRQEYYDGLADVIAVKAPEKKAALLNTIECAYARNELSESIYSELRELIADTENYDSCEKRAVEINNLLNQINLQNQGIPRYQVIDAAQIQNINNISDNFWNHHGYTKEDYMELASKLPEIQNAFANGKTYAEIKADSELQDTLAAYYSDDKMIQVVQDQNGTYQYQDDGRHRAMAAKELGCYIPVNVINSEEPVIMNYYENLSNIRNTSDSLSAYMREHNYGLADFAEYSQDPEWRSLQREAFPDCELPPLTQENAQRQLTQYMNEHNYGRDDYAEYSQDPVWRELHAAAYPDHELPPLGDSKEKIDTEDMNATDEPNDAKAKMIDEESKEVDAEEEGEEKEEVETEEEAEAEEEEEEAEEEEEEEEEAEEEEEEAEEAEEEEEEAEAEEEEETEEEEEEAEEEEEETEEEGEEVEAEEEEEAEVEEETETEIEEEAGEIEEEEEVETEDEIEADEVESEEAETEEIEAEEGIEIEEAKSVEEVESEEMDSVMMDDIENGESEDFGCEENSVMIEDLDNSDEITEMENNSELLNDLGETEEMNSSISESNDYSASSDGMTSDGGMNLE
ncbi:hypothetical protein [Blautia sp. An249]|uniref:hypothetical protein n=1 Tax=Blautia sp. An249 TaxID=1965603 RepID=UPI0013A660EA|nr:hypothetical protein [Blautia sp. An249]